MPIGSDSDEESDSTKDKKAKQDRIRMPPPPAMPRKPLPSRLEEVMTECSMSSSVMHRGDGLRLLDDRFDQLLYQHYDDSASDSDTESDPNVSDLEDPPQLLHPTRHHLETLPEIAANVDTRGDGGCALRASKTLSNARVEKYFDEFLYAQDIVGKRITSDAPTLAASAQMDRLREMLRDTLHITESDKIDILQPRDETVATAEEEVDEASDDGLFETKAERRTPWDCQTILSTYSNLEHHPVALPLLRKSNRRTRHVDQANSTPGAVIRMDGRGFARTIQTQSSQADDEPEEGGEARNDDEGNEVEEPLATRANLGIARPRDESASDKLQRKREMKERRAQARATKKALKERFATAKKKQGVASSSKGLVL